MIGKWEISNADRDRTCQLTFKADPSGTLFKLEPDKACAVQMPELKDVTGWTIGGLATLGTIIAVWVFAI